MIQQRKQRRFWGLTVYFLFALFIFGACSTEKNTFINRSYHSVTARYNGYFNANELIKESLKDYRTTVREDFTTILPIELYPREEDVSEFYPIVDTAIAKCQENISKHSMPTASKPSQKRTEYARWIDINWMMIGKSKYIRQDFDSAEIVFRYVRRFYDGKPSSLTAQLWEAKTQIRTGNLTEAKRTLQKVEKRKERIEEELAEKTPKTKKSRTKNVKKSDSKDNKVSKPPRDFDFELYKTKALFDLAMFDEKSALENLENALGKARKKYDKARLSFIIGQLLQKEEDARARDFYTQTIKKNAPFEMSFHAKINRAVVSNLDDDQMIKELKKLAKEQRYLEFRDQIYYSMSKIELNRPDRDMAKKYLSKSVFYSLNNNLQKGISYEKLGDLSFEEKDYVSAQLYYDSSAQFILESYANYDAIKMKADKLADLVEHVTVITLEDSVQRLAQMDDQERDKYLKDILKQLKQEEKDRKEREALRAEQLRKIQQSYAEQNQKQGSKFYFSNPKALREGVDNFKSLWGVRENQDYWRLSNRPNNLLFSLEEERGESDSLIVEEKTPEKLSLDSLTTDDLLKNIPLTDSALAISNKNLKKALYGAGMIYKEQLQEAEVGAHHFQRVIDIETEDKHNLLAAFQLYKMFEDKGEGNIYKSYILTNYPNSEYAFYIRNPDYFIHKKEREALAREDYLRSVKNFEQGLFYPVVLKADNVIEKDSANAFRKEYMLLKAMAMGHLNNDKTSLLPILNEILEYYPGTEVATRAQEYINLINNGVPAFEAFEEIVPEIFDFSGKEYYILVELLPEQNESNSLNTISNYNSVYFSRQKLNSKVQMYNRNKSFIMISDFRSSSQASSYIKEFKKSKRIARDFQANKIMLISKENFKIMLKEQKLNEYRKFYQANFE